MMVNKNENQTELHLPRLCNLEFFAQLYGTR